MRDLAQVHPEVHASFLQLLDMDPSAVQGMGLSFEVGPPVPATKTLDSIITQSPKAKSGQTWQALKATAEAGSEASRRP